MYRRPHDLDLSSVAGEFTTQVRVGQFDLQFTFGPVNFAVQSPVNFFRDGKQMAYWEEGRWPDPAFYEIMNVEVQRCKVVNDRLIVLEFENGITMHLEDILISTSACKSPSQESSPNGSSKAVHKALNLAPFSRWTARKRRRLDLR